MAWLNGEPCSAALTSALKLRNSEFSALFYILKLKMERLGGWKTIFRLSRVVVRVLEVQEVQVVRWTVGYITEECGAPSPPPPPPPEHNRVKELKNSINR